MKPSDICVGKTYRNKGKGTTTRTVLAIGNEHRPRRWCGNMDTPPDGPGVLFSQVGKPDWKLYLSSFAAWAGAEVHA